MKTLMHMMAAVVVTAALTGCPRDALAYLRVVYVVPDGPAIDTCLNGDKASGLSSLTYPSSSVYAGILPGDYLIKLVTAGSACANEGLVEVGRNLTRGSDTTVAFAGAGDNVEAVVYADNNADPTPGAAKVRFINLSADAGAVDLRDDDGAWFDSVDYRENGGYVEVQGGAYDLTITKDHGILARLNIENQVLNAGGVYTIFLVGTTDIIGNDLDVLVTLDN